MSNPLHWIAASWRRLQFYLNRDRFEREMAEEMRFHLDLKASANERSGMPAEEARFAARRQFGNAARLQEETAGVMTLGWIEAAWQDARYAARSLRMHAGFTIVAALSLALGIGATTAVFTLVNVMLVRPLPFPEPDRLVVPFQTLTPGVFSAADTIPWPYRSYEQLREMVPAFENAGFSSWEELNVRRMVPGVATETERVRLELVTPSLLATVRVRAQAGRVLDLRDETPAASGAVAVISDRLWRQMFDASPDAVGAAVDLGGILVTIVGVMPPEFTGFREGAQLWMPVKAIALLPGAATRRGPGVENRMGMVVARVRSGASLVVVETQVRAAAREIHRFTPVPFGRPNATWGAGVISLAEARRHPLVEPMLTLLTVAAASVLVIVCANIAGLLLARARARQAELGVRVALGASRARVARQMLTESLVLAVVGGVPGLALAYGGATALARLRPELPPAWTLMRSTDLLNGVSLVPDWRVLSFALALTVLVGLLFGAAPALAASRTSVAELIKVAGGSRGSTAEGRGRRVLVVGQVALATILLIAAGLMTRSVRALLRSDVGFDPDGVVALPVAGTDTTLGTRSQQREAILDRIAALPGVVAAASHNCVPFGSTCIMAPLSRVDERAVERSEYPPIEIHVITPDYLRVMGVPLRAGRGFDAREASGPSMTALVNETFAKRVWPGQSPIGRRFVTGAADGDPVEVVGVVADTKYNAIDEPVSPAVYYSSAHRDSPMAVLFARVRTDPAQAIATIRREVRRMAPALAIHQATTGETLLRDATSSRRFIAVLLLGFSAIAAFLAALGVYGVLAYSVMQRMREFGIRMAVGAQPSSVLAIVVRQGLLLTVLGLGLGVAGALGATDLLSRFLFGVERSDAATYLTIVSLVGLLGVGAAFVPALRATRVDPVVALRD